MIVKLIWFDCDLSKQSVTDAFWVQCTQEEAEAILSKYQHIENRFSTMDTDCPDEFKPCFTFLVAKNLKHIWQMDWYYPYSGQWNAYCPFRKLPHPIEIMSLEELQKIPPQLI